MPNQLQYEKSPYLLQHAENPINWYPWSDKAFEKATIEDKPIFLSIGYSTCHWCHVMAHESFEDNDIAAILNKEFISIKVDREERPDIDCVYMSVCQAMTGSGGWPLTIIMTPDKKPFFAGTYFPKESGYSNIGLRELLLNAVDLWDNNRKVLLNTTEEVLSFLSKEADITETRPSKELINIGVSQLSELFDAKWGGFGTAPKFPSPHNLLFLLQYSSINADNLSLNIVTNTLDNMYKGGIFDHIGGGFSRYSTDEKWLVPHFEKMLYDNALLSLVYLEAYVKTNKVIYREIAQKTLQYVMRELTDIDGGFYCSQDADSDGIEGKYYLFSHEEIVNILGKEDGEYFCKWFDITRQGNFEKKNIPNLIGNKNWEKKNERIEMLCKQIRQYRLNRTFLHKDDKILTSWNSLMITAFSKASLICNNAKYLSYAKKAENFININLTSSDNTLFVRYRDGEAAFEGQLDDYAFYCYALISLYEVTFETEYLEKAIGISEKMIDMFFDNSIGGFYIYSNRSEQLISRPKEIYDGAMPSGNSMAAHVLVKLAALTGEIKWQQIRDKHLNFLASSIEDYPYGYCFSLSAMCSVLYKSAQLIAVSSNDDIPDEFKSFIGRNTFANLTVIFKSPKNQNTLTKLIPFTANYPIPKNGIQYYLCQGNSCSPPLTDISKIEESLSLW